MWCAIDFMSGVIAVKMNYDYRAIFVGVPSQGALGLNGTSLVLRTRAGTMILYLVIQR